VADHHGHEPADFSPSSEDFVMRKPSTLIAKLTARWARPAPRKPSYRAAPLLETLEDRTLLSGLHYLTNQHTDLDVTYSSADGKLHLSENNKNKDPIKYYKNTKHFVLEFLPEAQGTQTSDPRYAFTGAAPGDPIWIVPISPRNPDLLQLGVSAERIDDGVLGAYYETDPRVTNGFQVAWIRINLVDVQGPGYFSVWQVSDPLSRAPTVWMSTYDNPNPNLFFTLPNGHFDYNWAFTQPGNYTVDFQATAYLPDGTAVSSDVTPYHFQVDAGPVSGAHGKNTSRDSTQLPNQLVAGNLTPAPVLAPSQATVSLVPAQAGRPADSLAQTAAADHLFASLGNGRASALAGNHDLAGDAAAGLAGNELMPDALAMI
jgi:surface-anchored protein